MHNDCIRLHTKCIQPYKSEGNMKMPSGVGWEDISIPPFIARHRGIEAVSGPKLIADCFQPFSELFSPSSPTAMPTSGPEVPSNATVRPGSGSRRDASAVLWKSSVFRRLSSVNLQSGDRGDSGHGKRRRQAVFTLSSHLCVRMHFVCSRMQSVCTFCLRARS